MLPALIGRVAFGLGMSLAGAGILIGFAALGAVGIIGQRCVALWVTPNAEPIRAE